MNIVDPGERLARQTRREVVVDVADRRVEQIEEIDVTRMRDAS